jgi:peptidoglycan hydrolase-like protein with peptidoglycan-binding domain
LGFAGIIAPLKRPPALVGALFFALAAGIVANALLLQPRPHPAPLVHTRADSAPGVRESDALIRAVQSELREAGYYSGPLDGLAGTNTQAAIAAFQASAGANATGTVSFELLSSIRAANRSGKARAGGAIAAEPDGRVAAVQDALARSAYGPLTADGVFGPQTRDAIIRFQRDHGLPLTGAINDSLMVELRAAGALDPE